MKPCHVDHDKVGEDEDENNLNLKHVIVKNLEARYVR